MSDMMDVFFRLYFRESQANFRASPEPGTLRASFSSASVILSLKPCRQSVELIEISMLIDLLTWRSYICKVIKGDISPC